MAGGHVKSHFLFVSLLDSGQVGGIPSIHCGKDGGFLDQFKSTIDQRQGSLSRKDRSNRQLQDRGALRAGQWHSHMDNVWAVYWKPSLCHDRQRGWMTRWVGRQGKELKFITCWWTSLCGDHVWASISFKFENSGSMYLERSEVAHSSFLLEASKSRLH